MRVGSVMAATGLVTGGRPRSDDRGWLGVKVTAGREDYALCALTRPCGDGDRRPSR